MEPSGLSTLPLCSCKFLDAEDKVLKDLFTELYRNFSLWTLSARDSSQFLDFSVLRDVIAKINICLANAVDENFKRQREEREKEEMEISKKYDSFDDNDRDDFDDFSDTKKKTDSDNDDNGDDNFSDSKQILLLPTQNEKKNYPNKYGI